MSKQVTAGWNETKFSTLLSERKERLSNNGRIPLFSLTIKDGITPKTERYEREFLVSDKGNKTYKVIHPNDLVFNPSNLRWGAIARSKVRYSVLASPIYEVLYPKSPDVIDPLYLDYIAHSDHMHLKYLHYMEGTLVERTALKIKDFLNLTVELPPLPEQKKIASILTSVDEVIEKTQSQIDKLQDLKKGMMNELLTKGIGHTEFKDSELGRIPKSWEVKNLKNLVDDRRPITYGIVQTGENIQNGVPCVRVVDIVKNDPEPENMIRTSNDISESYKRTILRENDILFALRGEIGHVVRASSKIEGCNLTRGIALISFSHNVESKYLIWALRSENVRKGILDGVNGSALQEIPLVNLRTVRVPVPSIEEQNKIAKTLESIDFKVRNTAKKLQQTQSLKKSLMQDLLTGKVRVSVN